MGKIGKVATKIRRDENGNVFVRYHNTDVVTITDHSVILNHGGWITRTTLRRMNQASEQWNLGYRVFQRKGHLMLHWVGCDFKWHGVTSGDSRTFTMNWCENPLNQVK